MPEIRVSGVNIYYEINGKGHALVLIHGGGLDSGRWRSQVAFFSVKYQVITCDTRGHGRSEVPEGDYSIIDCVEDLRQLLDRLEIRRMYLAGLSMGGNIAINFTLRYLEMVDALILASSNSGPMSAVSMRKGDEAVDRMISLKRTDMAIKYRKAHDANVYRQDITGRLSEIKKPVLIISGDRDTEVPHYVFEEMHRRIENSERVVIPDCGHLCNEDQPEAFNSIVSDFLRRVEGCPGVNLAP